MEAELAIHVLSDMGSYGITTIQHNLLFKKRLELIGLWFLLLNKDQEHVVRRHLVDRLSWPQVTEEYAQLWPETAKTEGTLIRIQHRAIVVIEEFTMKHIDSLADLLNPIA